MIIQADVFAGIVLQIFKLQSLFNVAPLIILVSFFSVAQRYQVFRVPRIFMCICTKSC